MCDPLAGAAPETCDGLDNDCDGSADEGFGILECGLGECKHSIPMCLEGKPQACDPTAGATAEWCDGKDNDCNGIADETFPLGLACAVGVGECTAVGLTVCAPGGKSTTCSVVPLPPAQDLCDGLDNDCDGLADEDFQLGKPCIVGSGTCTALGVTVCDQSKTATVCGAAPGTPAEEKCDGKDNDCNGKADDPFPLNKPCTAGIGECKTLGTTTCAADGDGVECNAIPGDPANELCDGKDNDCDGKTDETWPTLGTACAAGMGECKDWGVMACTANHQAAYCTADPNPSQDETCDGKDNDCDGKTDEEWPDLGKPCTEGLGECKDNGVVACTKDGLASECTANPALPEDETCDGKDNDCDGKADEEWPNLGKLCFAGEGICKTAGIFLCFEGDAVCSAMPGNPADEICDGLDNDCNGSADELWPELYQPCSQGTGECAAQGVFVCAPGGTVCTAKPGNPAAETCDGKDNDCDGQTDEDTATVCQVCNGPQGLTNLPKDTPCGNGKLCDGNGQCIDNCSLAATGLYKSCYEIHQACPQLPTGSYKITPQAAGIDVTCNMTDSDGGWTRMTGQYLATLGNTTREYLYLKDGAWYRSPPTTLVWSWATYTVLEGTYAYGGVNGAGSFPCSHNEQGFWGVGCSNGGGHQWKCFVHGQGNKDTVNGRTSICQDIPDVFQVGACAPWVEIYVRP
jgi:hypothetical protein